MSIIFIVIGLLLISLSETPFEYGGWRGINPLEVFGGGFTIFSGVVLLLS